MYRTDSPGSSFFLWLKSVEDHSPLIPCFSLQYVDIYPLTDDVHTICGLLKLQGTAGVQQVYNTIQSLDSHNTVDLIEIHVSLGLIRSTFIFDYEPNVRNNLAAVIIASCDDAASEVIDSLSEILRSVGSIRLNYQPKLLQSNLLSVSRMLQKELQQAATTYRCAAERALMLARKPKNLNFAESDGSGNEVLLGPRLRLRVSQEVAMRNISLQIVSNRGISSLLWARTAEDSTV